MIVRKPRNPLPLLLSLLVCLGGQARELARTEFAQGENAAGWNIKLFGDQSARWLQPAGSPLFMASPTAKSWVFAVRDFFPADLGDAQRVRLTAWVCSNQPEKATYVIAEQASWGEAIDRSVRATGRQALVWEPIELVLERGSPDKMVSFALGLDYYTEGAWLAVGAVRLEAARDGEAFGPPAAKPTYDPVLPDEVRQWFVTGADNGQLVWQVWPDLAAFDADTRLEGASSTALRFDLPQNGFGAATVVIGNASDYVEAFRLQVTGDIAEHVSLSRLAWIGKSPDYLVPWRAADILEIGRRQCVGFEVNAHSASLAPGVYTGALRLAPVDGRLPERVMALELKVYPVTLPPRLPIRLFTWDYGWSADAAKLDFLRQARVNVFSIPLYLKENAENPLLLDAALDNLQAVFAPGEFQLIVEIWHVNQQGGWRDEDNAWLDRLTEKISARGLGYEDWYLHIYDEQLSEPFLRSARAIKAHNPRVRIFSDWLVREAAVVERFLPAVDAWCPLAGFLPPKEQSFLAGLDVMRTSGKPLWSYSCDATPEQSPSGYRTQSWQAFKLGLDGTAFWSARHCAFRSAPGEPNFGITYPADHGGATPSRRWNQLRMGLEDFLLLDLAARRTPSLAWLPAAVDDVLAAPDPSSSIAAVRVRLLEELSR